MGSGFGAGNIGGGANSLISLRNMIKMAAAEHGVAFSYMPLFIKVCGGWGWGLGGVRW